MSAIQPLSLAELLVLLPRIGATLELLVGKAPPPEARKARPGDRRRKNSGLPDKLLTVLKQSKAGYALGELQKRVGAGRGAVKYHLRALRRQKKVRVKGNRKLARWTAV